MAAEKHYDHSTMGQLNFHGPIIVVIYSFGRLLCSQKGVFDFKLAVDLDLIPEFFRWHTEVDPGIRTVR